VCFFRFCLPPACETRPHLSARHGSALVPHHVKLVQRVLVGQRTRVDGAGRRSHAHHQDLLTVWRLAHNEGIVLQVRDHWHQCSAAAAPPAAPLPQQGSSQQSRAPCQGDGGGDGGEDRRRGRTAGDSEGLKVCTAWNNHWPGKVGGVIVKLVKCKDSEMLYITKSSRAEAFETDQYKMCFSHY